MDIRDAANTLGRVSSTWVLVAKDRTVLDLPAIRERAATASVRAVRPWTDDYANILAALKIGSEEGHVIVIDAEDDRDSAQETALTARGQ